jgi:hypothetical protein
MSNEKAWATQKLFADLFHNHFVPEVEKHQMYELKHEPKSVKALLLWTMLLLTPQPIF